MTWDAVRSTLPNPISMHSSPRNRFSLQTCGALWEALTSTYMLILTPTKLENGLQDGSTFLGTERAQRGSTFSRNLTFKFFSGTWHDGTIYFKVRDGDNSCNSSRNLCQSNAQFRWIRRNKRSARCWTGKRTARETGGFTEKSHKTLIQLSSAYVAEPLDYVGGLGGALLWVRHTVTMRYERSNPSFSRTLAFYQTHPSSCL